MSVYRCFVHSHSWKVRSRSIVSLISSELVAKLETDFRWVLLLGGVVLVHAERPVAVNLVFNFVVDLEVFV